MTLHRIHAALALALALGCAAVSCDSPEKAWEKSLHTVTVSLCVQDNPEEQLPGGIPVHLADVHSTLSYTLSTDTAGKVRLALPNGLYRISASYRDNAHIYNGTKEMLVNGASRTELLPLTQAESGNLVIRELYIGGCSKDPDEGNYHLDRYILLHNNHSETVYLDSLCLAFISPYNATGNNNWRNLDGSLPALLPLADVIWRIAGNGQSFPLAPGEDVPIALDGAINHKRQYKLSVNLDSSVVFACYTPNRLLFSEDFLLDPGPNIQEDHWLEVVNKYGAIKGNPVSVSSPAVVIFRPTDIRLEDYLAQPDIIRTPPGKNADWAALIPPKWVIDAVEVFDGRSSNNKKRLPNLLDAGFVVQSEPHKGRTLQRKNHAEATDKQGYLVLQDTNHSGNDFFESDTHVWGN